MTRLYYPAALGLALCAGQTLSTDYARDRALRIEVESTFSMETTDFSMERDGEPVDSPFGGGGQRSSETRSVVMIDRVLEHEDGEPIKVRREFELVGAKSVATMRDEERESERECPLSEVTLELVFKDGDVIAEVVDGSEPDDDALLEGHLLALGLDALLPEDDVDADDTWELDGEMLMRACGLDLEKVLFPPPPREERGEGGEGRRGGGRGQRGGRTRGGGGSVAGYFENGDWEAEATLEADTEEWEGTVCHVITIEAECSGEMPEQERGGGGGGRGGGGGGGGGGGALTFSSPVIPENSFEVELEGKLLFSVDEGRPIHFELEGTVSTDSLREMNRREVSMVISTTREGTFKHVVDISAVESDE